MRVFWALLASITLATYAIASAQAVGNGSYIAGASGNGAPSVGAAGNGCKRPRMASGNGCSPSPTPSPSPNPSPTLPPQGLYTTCDILDTYSTCTAHDAAMQAAGFTIEVDYNGLLSHKTGGSSLTAWLANSASIGITQFLSVKAAAQAAGDWKTSTSLVNAFKNGGNGLPNDCGATNNQQLIDCIVPICNASSACGGYYVYDEPGCAHQSTGYCQGSNAGSNYANIESLSAYLKTASPTKRVIGVQTPSGVPPGGWTGGNAAKQINDLYSCNGAPECAGSYPWLTSPNSPFTGYDYYPFPEGDSRGQHVSDIATVSQLIASTINANYPPEQVYGVVQAFSWFQYGAGFCPDMTTCPYPTQVQLQAERDAELFNGSLNGIPLAGVFYYSLEDNNCNHAYTGCSSSANWTSLTGAAFAPYPTPTPVPTPTPTPTAAATPYRGAVLADTPVYFWQMSGAGSTEPDLGSAGQALTYHGTGTQGGTALIIDGSAASYSPGASSSNYAEANASLSGWPSSSGTTMTWEAWVKIDSTDCGAGDADILNTWGVTGSATFSLDIVNDGTSCHLRATSDNGSNSAASANGSLAVGSIYMVDVTYDKAVGLTIFINAVSSGTNASKYMNAWSSQSGPVMIGQNASRSTLNNAAGNGLFHGPICCISMYTSVLSGARITAHYNAGHL